MRAARSSQLVNLRLSLAMDTTLVVRLLAECSNLETCFVSWSESDGWEDDNSKPDQTPPLVLHARAELKRLRSLEISGHDALVVIENITTPALTALKVNPANGAMWWGTLSRFLRRSGATLDCLIVAGLPDHLGELSLPGLKHLTVWTERPPPAAISLLSRCPGLETFTISSSDTLKNTEDLSDYDEDPVYIETLLYHDVDPIHIEDPATLPALKMVNISGAGADWAEFFDWIEAPNLHLLHVVHQGSLLDSTGVPESVQNFAEMEQSRIHAISGGYWAGANTCKACPALPFDCQCFHCKA